MGKVSQCPHFTEEHLEAQGGDLTQATQLCVLLTSFSAVPNPGVGNGAGEGAGLLARLRAPGCLWGQPWRTPRSSCYREPLRGPRC